MYLVVGLGNPGRQYEADFVEPCEPLEEEMVYFN